MQRDPDGIATLSIDLHDQFKYKALGLIEDAIRATSKVNVKGVKINSCDGTPRQHKEELLRMLKRLRIRFQRTASSERGKCFREDIEQLLLDLQQVLYAGMANCFHVKYIKWDATKGKTQNLFSV